VNDELKRIMALQAACIACECIGPVNNEVMMVQAKIERFYSDQIDSQYPTFGEYLDAQREATFEL